MCEPVLFFFLQFIGYRNVGGESEEEIIISANLRTTCKEEEAVAPVGRRFGGSPRSLSFSYLLPVRRFPAKEQQPFTIYRWEN